MRVLTTARLLAGTVLALGCVLIAAAPAAAAGPGTLTAGVAVTATISTPDTNLSYTFAGTSGRHATLDVSASSWPGGGSATLKVFNPENTFVTQVALGQSPTYLDFAMAETGTWTVVVDGTGNSTGSATFTYVTDVGPQALDAGVRVATTIAYRGQNAVFTFAATSGRHATFDVSASSWPGGGSATLRVYDPAGTFITQVGLNQSPTFVDFSIGTTGTWTMVLDPTGGSTGKATIGLAFNVGPRAMGNGTTYTTTTHFRGQNAVYTFPGTTGRHLTLDVSSSSWPNGGSATLRVYNPAGTFETQVGLNQSPTFVDFTPDSTGTWTAILDPTGASTGTATVTLARDIGPKALTAGTAVTATINHRGQNAVYTLAATNGQQLHLNVTASTWPNGSAVLRVYNPSGTFVTQVGLNQSPTSLDFTANVTGTWTVLVDPAGASTGHTTFAYTVAT